MKYVLLVLFAVWGLPCFVFAQATLPDISVRELTRGKVQISWINPHGENCTQLAIQRSGDSTKNFRTIFSSHSPELPSNGFVDNMPLRGITSYYRIFYVLSAGAYYFSKAEPVKIEWENTGFPTAHRTVDVEKENITGIVVNGRQIFAFTKEEYALFRDSVNKQTDDKLRRIDEHTIEWRPVAIKGAKELISVYDRKNLIGRMTQAHYKKFRDSVAQTKDSLYVIYPYRIQLRTYIKQPDFIFVYRNDSLMRQIRFLLYPQFKDSIISRTRDTIFMTNPSRIDIHPFVPTLLWNPSRYVFTNVNGYVSIVLPQLKQYRYRIIFYEGEKPGAVLFEIKSLKEPELILDKINFIHAGWFNFELYENDKLKEKNKLFLSKD